MNRPLTFDEICQLVAYGCFAISSLLATCAPVFYFVTWPWLVEKFRKKEPTRSGGGLME